MNRRLILPGIALLTTGIALGIILMHYLNAPGESVQQQEGRIVKSIQVGASPSALRVDPGDALGINEVFKQVAREVTPTVVAIYASQSRGSIGQGEDGGLFDRFPRRPQIASAGSGVVISEEGYLVTNSHVVDQAESIRVVFADKREVEAELVGQDPTTDLAVLRVNADDLPVALLGDSDDLEVGEWVLAVGNPYHLSSTVTQGIVSAIGRQVDIIAGQLGIEDFIQTDAAINPGNSGGALVDLQGRLVGINTAIASERGGYEGYGFAVPVNLVTHIVQELIAYGEVQRGFLGIQMVAVTADNYRAAGLEEITGVLIDNVLSEGPAGRAGLLEGDIILAIDGFDVREPNQLRSRLARYRPGDTIELDIKRREDRKTVLVSLMGQNEELISRWLNPNFVEPVPELPEDAPAIDPGPGSPFRVMDEWGVVLRDLSEERKVLFGVEYGAYIAHVQKDGQAHIDRLPRGVVLLEIDGEPVASADDAATLFDLAYSDEQQSVLITVLRRNGIKAFYEVTVPSMDEPAR